MKHILRRLQRHHALCRARWRARPALSVAEKMHRGSLIGLVVCLLCAIAIGGHSAPALWAGLLGAAVGALIGLLLWLGSDHFAEQPIPPPLLRWRVAPGVAYRTSPGKLPRRLDGRRHVARPRHRRQH